MQSDVLSRDSDLQVLEVDTWVGWIQSLHSGPSSSVLTSIHCEIRQLHFFAVCCPDQNEAYSQIVEPHHFPSRLFPNGVLDPDPLLVSILLRRRQLRSGFVVIGRP